MFLNINKNLVIIFFIFFICICKSFADLNISPGYVSLGGVDGLEPGKKYKFRIMVENPSIKSNQYIQTDIESNPKDLDEKWNYDVNKGDNPLATWATISEKKFLLGKKQSKELVVTIKVPRKAEPGDYRLSIIVGDDKDRRIEQAKKLEMILAPSEVSAQMIPISRVAIPLRVRIKGKSKDSLGNINFKKSIAIENTKKEIERTVSSMPKMTGRIVNKGSYQMVSSGVCDLRNEKNVTILSSPIQTVAVFPRESTRFTCMFPGYLPAKEYKVVISLKNTVKNTVISFSHRHETKFTITKKDELALSNSMSAKLINELMTPLMIERDVLRIDFDKGKSKYIKEKFKIKNMSSERITVRPFFISLPDKKITNLVKIKEKRIYVKPYTERFIHLSIKKEDKNLHGKIILSAKEYKNRIPASINIVPLKDVKAKDIDISYVGQLNVTKEKGVTKAFIMVKNTGEAHYEGTFFRLWVEGKSAKSRIKYDSYLFKQSLLPGEATGVHFDMPLLSEDEYTFTFEAMYQKTFLKNRIFYLEVTREEGKDIYKVIDLKDEDNESEGGDSTDDSKEAAKGSDKDKEGEGENDKDERKK